MDVGLATAGLICVGMAFGHAAIGWLWVLPSLTEERVRGTPFGSPSMTVSMLRVTWYIVTVFVLALGAVLLWLAWDSDANSKTILLRWFAGMWLTGAVMALGISAHRVRSLRGVLRLPVPILWVVVAVLLWNATT